MPADASAAAAIIYNHVHFNHIKETKLIDTDSNNSSVWQRLPDLPCSEEILADDSSDNLPWFPVKYAWKTKAEYLEALYRILRFEGVEGLRYSVRNMRASPSMSEDDNTCIYTKVHVKGYLFAKLGPIARVSFSTVRAGVKIKWNQSKRLQPGKTVALSSDFFKTDCRVAVVAQRPIEGGLDQSPPVVDIIWARVDQALFDPDQELIMIESRNGYFEAVRHALKGLQHAAREWSPLDKYVVSLSRSDLPCSSVAKALNLSSLVDHLPPNQLSGDKTAELEAFCNTEDRFKHMNRESLNDLNELQQYTSLDVSQLEALQRIITKEIAIIQGPPGTGKTFTSVKAINALLQNRCAGDPPIIVSAQTNHALDQLLIYCKSAGGKIMRMGGRTDNDEIAQRIMYELRLATKSGGQGRILDKERLMIADRFEGLVHGVFGGTGLLDPQNMLKAGVLTKSQYNSFADEDWEGEGDKSVMDAWLGSEKIERIRQRGDLEFDEFEAPDEVETDENLTNEQIDDDGDPIRGRFVPLSGQNTGQRPHVASWESRCRAMLEKYSNLYDIPRGYRGGVYQIMEQKLRKATAAKFRSILDQAIKQAQAVKTGGWIKDLRVIDSHCIDIIGCTTTGLTKYRGFLSAIQPRILLVEEAAETREANIASALFPSLQQLVLVGDHQQLPPPCDIARLAKHPYNLNISLFERLVENSLPYTMLNCQRRMAPELCNIVHKFYPRLKNHPLVHDISKRPLVPGLGDRRSWFFTHSWPESTDVDNSKFNQAEVDMVVSFVRYLLQNGVDASEITILTYYKGQKRRLLNRLRQRFSTGKFFNIATIDSYQGEENEIVILSLVRSPGSCRDYQVGFLDSRNRATVAISRARRGFFMFGNKENILNASIDSFNTWAPIWNAFAEQHRVAMSKGMPLICQNHGNEIWVKDADGLVGNAGGCWTPCDGQLSCGHACGRMCHITSHELVRCSRPCTRALECGHKCAVYCSDPCQCTLNCPDFFDIRLRMQLAQAQRHRQFRISDTRSFSPTELTTSHSASACSADWQDMVQNPHVHDCKERLKIMGDMRITEDTLKNAFGDIEETYIAVSDRHGHRVQRITKNTDVRAEAYIRQQMFTATSPSGGSGATRSRQISHSTCGQHVSVYAVDQYLDGGTVRSRMRTAHSGKNTSRIGSKNGADSRHGQQGSKTRHISRSSSIDTIAASTSAAAVCARSNAHGSGATSGQGWTDSLMFKTVQSFTQMTSSNDAVRVRRWGPRLFDEELSQAIRRSGELQTPGFAQPLPHIQGIQSSVQRLTDGMESLIDLGDNGDSLVPRKLQSGRVKNAKSLVDLGLDKAISMASFDIGCANQDFLVDDI